MLVIMHENVLKMSKSAPFRLASTFQAGSARLSLRGGPKGEALAGPSRSAP